MTDVKPNLSKLVWNGGFDYSVPISGSPELDGSPYDLARSFSGKTEVYVPTISTDKFKQGYFFDYVGKTERYDLDATKNNAGNELSTRFAIHFDNVPGYWTVGIGGASSKKYNKEYDPNFDPKACVEGEECVEPPEFIDTLVPTYTAQWLYYKDDIINVPIVGVTLKGKGNLEYSAQVATNFYAGDPVPGMFIQGAFTGAVAPAASADEKAVYTYNLTSALTINGNSSDPKIVENKVYRIEGSGKVANKQDSEEDSYGAKLRLSVAMPILGNHMPTGEDAVSVMSVANGRSLPVTMGLGLTFYNGYAPGATGFDALYDIPDYNALEGDFVNTDEIDDIVSCKDDWLDPDACYQKLDQTTTTKLTADIEVRTKPGKAFLDMVYDGDPPQKGFIEKVVEKVDVVFSANAGTDLMSLGQGPLIDDWALYAKASWQFKPPPKKD